jgi:hypothetical protein
MAVLAEEYTIVEYDVGHSAFACRRATYPKPVTDEEAATVLAERAWRGSSYAF